MGVSNRASNLQIGILLQDHERNLVLSATRISVYMSSCGNKLSLTAFFALVDGEGQIIRFHGLIHNLLLHLQLCVRNQVAMLQISQIALVQETLLRSSQVIFIEVTEVLAMRLLCLI